MGCCRAHFLLPYGDYFFNIWIFTCIIVIPVVFHAIYKKLEHIVLKITNPRVRTDYNYQYFILDAIRVM